MITDIRADMIATVQSLLGPAIAVVDQTVREIEREKLRKQTCIMGPDNTTYERASRTHIDERYEFVISIVNPLKNDPLGKIAQETMDSLVRRLLKKRRLDGTTQATVLSSATETLTDDDQYRQAGQITSSKRVVCGVYA